MIRYLLDTNIVIYVIKRRPIEVLSRFNANATRMAISAITLAELMHGAEKSSQRDANLAVVEDFCSRLEVLPYGMKAAQHYGAIRAALERGARQDSCRLIHAAKGCLSVARDVMLTTESRSGLSVTAPMGSQLRVWRDQRAGLRSRAWTYSA